MSRCTFLYTENALHDRRLAAPNNVECGASFRTAGGAVNEVSEWQRMARRIGERAPRVDRPRHRKPLITPTPSHSASYRQVHVEDRDGKVVTHVVEVPLRRATHLDQPTACIMGQPFGCAVCGAAASASNSAVTSANRSDDRRQLLFHGAANRRTCV